MVIRLDRSIRQRFTVAVIFLTWLLLVRGAAELYNLSVPTGTGPQPVRNVGSPGRSVALTFNVTWGEEVPSALLKTLAEHNVRATWFVAGPWAATHHEILQKMAADGHDIGSYGWRHLDLTQFTGDDLRDELQTAAATLADGAGSRPVLFRPPAGAYDANVIGAAAELGMITVLWDVDPQDWLQPGTEQITAVVLREAQPGSIILLHGGDTNVQTLRALPAIIRGLRERDLEPRPLTNMLEDRAPGSEAIQPRQ